MSEKKCKNEGINDYKSAFECFKQRFLIEKKSIFRLSDNDEVLTQGSIDYLKTKFIDNGYLGNTSAAEKFYRQITDKNITDELLENLNEEQRKAIEVLATAVWLWRLPAKNTNKEGRTRLVQEILNYSNKTSIDDGNPFIYNDYCGFATLAQGYNSSKADHLAYIIKFFEYFLEKEFLKENVIEYLLTTRSVDITTTHEYSVVEKKYTIKKIDGIKTPKNVPDISNALLYLLDSDNFQPIVADKHKQLIIKTFENFKDFKIEPGARDDKINQILVQLKNKNQKYHFYHSSIKNIWLGGLDFESKNMILHGAPGTGKTYITEETIKARKLIEQDSEYALVQFHPSYGYEDFIEGIKPVGLENGQMKFALKNGVFKEMCIKAFSELKENPFNPKKFYFIADEINRAELSRVFGELLLCLEDEKRLKIIDEKVVGTKVKLPNSSLWEKEHVVCFANNEDKLLEDSTSIDKKEWYFGVPENVYFIGTMNDIDRSVDSFDMALRRRFVWKHYRCDYDIIENKYSGDNMIDAYIKACQELNAHITSEKGFNLSSSYELGQSYFMKPKRLIQNELNRVWIEHIAPILKEYLRAEYSEQEIDSHLKDAKKVYSLK